jgi:hypothetical protein
VTSSMPLSLLLMLELSFADEKKRIGIYGFYKNVSARIRWERPSYRGKLRA